MEISILKIVIINGSPRKGNTYKATKLFADEMKRYGDIEYTKFFLPKDLPEFCMGCISCFENGEQTCPHSEYTLPILESLLIADAIIFTTPVYVLQSSGAVKSFLDHFGFMFIVHRARPEMFSKKAFIISTTAGAGTKQAMKTISTSLKYWGVNRVYSIGFPLHEVSWDKMKPKRMEKFERKIQSSAKRFYREVSSGKKHAPYLMTRLMFYFIRTLIKGYDNTNSLALDKKYWEEQNWFSKNPF